VAIARAGGVLGVVAACLIVEAIVAKNVMDVTVNIAAFLAPLWVFALSLAWPIEDRTSRAQPCF
jgi:hypothetical protein